MKRFSGFLLCVSSAGLLANAAVSQEQQPAQESQQDQWQSQPSGGLERQGQEQTQTGAQQGQQSLQQLTSEHQDLSTFVRALEETGLAETITEEGQTYTAFAPTNEAFEQHGDIEQLMSQENRDQLIELLRNHLVADELDAQRARELGQALTVSGNTLSLQESGGELTVNGTPVADTDIRAGGLIVHTVEEVLEPTGSTQTAAADQQAGQTRQPGEEQGVGAAGQYPPFEEVDTNSDGQIGRIELAQVEGLDFSEVDTNQDGNITREEYTQAAQE